MSAPAKTLERPNTPAASGRAAPRAAAAGLLLHALIDTDPAARLREARDGGRLGAVLPEIEPCLGFAQGSRHHAHTVDEHLFRAAGQAARLGAPWRVRVAALLHDIGKPAACWLDETGRRRFSPNAGVPGAVGHDRTGAAIASALLLGLGQPARFARQVSHLVREHMYCDDREPTPAAALAFVARVGGGAAADLMLLRRCDWGSKREGGLRPEDDERLTCFERLVAEVEVPLVLAA